MAAWGRKTGVLQSLPVDVASLRGARPRAASALGRATTHTGGRPLCSADAFVLALARLVGVCQAMQADDGAMTNPKAGTARYVPCRPAVPLAVRTRRARSEAPGHGQGGASRAAARTSTQPRAPWPPRAQVPGRGAARRGAARLAPGRNACKRRRPCEHVCRGAEHDSRSGNRAGDAAPTRCGWARAAPSSTASPASYSCS